MTALSADLESKRQDSEIVNYPVLSSTTIYKGSLVVDIGTGYASPGSNDGSYTFLGVAMENVTNAGADGAKSVRLYKTGSYEFSKPTAVQTDLGVVMYIRDDQTVDTTSTNSISAGYVVGIPDSSHVRLRIDIAVK